jgi:hypothetical protein
LIVDVISDHHHHSEDIHVDVDVDVGQVFKLPPPPLLAQIQKPNSNYQNDRLQDFVQRDITDQSNFFNSFYSDSVMFFCFVYLHCLNVLNISFC